MKTAYRNYNKRDIVQKLVEKGLNSIEEKESEKGLNSKEEKAVAYLDIDRESSS